MEYKYLIVAILAGIAIHYSFRKFASELKAMPENIKECESKDPHSLKFESFKTDKDVVPGKSVTMIADFMPSVDGIVNVMLMEVYKFGVKIYTQTVPGDHDFKKDSNFEYDFTTTLPGFVPPIKVNMKMEFKNKDAQLGCFTFDLDFSKKSFF